MTDRNDRAPIDWAALAARLARVGELVRAGGRPSGAAAREALLARGRALAQPVGAAPGAALEAVVLVLGGERYAIEAALVREVRRVAQIARLPGGPAFLVGAANLRGEVVDVLDLRTFLGAPPGPPGPERRLIVLGRDRAEFALLADGVPELARLDLAALRPPPDAPARQRPEYVRGVADGGVALLDGAALLLDPRLAVDGGGALPEVI